MNTLFGPSLLSPGCVGKKTARETCPGLTCQGKFVGPHGGGTTESRGAGGGGDTTGGAAVPWAKVLLQLLKLLLEELEGGGRLQHALRPVPQLLK